MKIAVNELSGSLLDWAVAVARGATFDFEAHKGEITVVWDDKFDIPLRQYSPSRFWEQGGPLLQHGKFELFTRVDPLNHAAMTWICGPCNGSTALVAITRRYVYDAVGMYIDVPQEVVDRLQ